nr:outer membrane protein porin [Tanacetum cinerariifolium]
MMNDQLAEEKNNVHIKKTEISELKECLRKKDFENEHLKSKVVDFTTVQNLQVQVKELQSENEHLKSKVVDCQMCQNLQVQVEELKSVNESFNLSIEELYKARALAEATLRERDEKIYVLQKKLLETKFKVLKHDHSLEKMFEMIEQEYESNVLKISITSSTIETNNLELVKEMGDKVKRFDDEKKVFENKISKLEKDLTQRVKDFDDLKTELSRRTDKFETYFANLKKENVLLKSQLASQNYTSLQKENNDLRTSYNVLKEEYEISCAKLKKDNNDLNMHYKRLFDSIKQKKVASQVFTKSIPKVNVSDKIYTGESSKSISKKVS